MARACFKRLNTPDIASPLLSFQNREFAPQRQEETSEKYESVKDTCMTSAQCPDSSRNDRRLNS
ncbi:hypothetical protein BDW72DRAFT_182671 [Aspergillus terricola var. indicus]